MKTHELKIKPHFFTDIYFGFKHHEFRLNDRDFKLGDRLLLKEYLKNNTYSGNELLCDVTYILDCCPIMDDYSCNWVVMEIKTIGGNFNQDFAKERGL